MDALKLAFDTMIVGILALPWLAILVLIFSRSSSADSSAKTLSLFSGALERTPAAVSSVLLVAVGYLLGSAVSRVSADFFDDELWGRLPSEHAIRQSVYCGDSYAVVMNGWPVPWSDLTINQSLLCSTMGPEVNVTVLEIFRLQESKLLLAGSDKIDRLQQFHEQIVVLRGAALNGIVLSVLCAFGYFADYRARRRGRQSLLSRLSFLPALVLTIVGGVALWSHMKAILPRDSYSQPPMVETVLILLGAAGFFVVPNQGESHLYRNGCFLGLIFAIIAYGGWWWTEVLYDEQVIHSFYMLTAQ